MKKVPKKTVRDAGITIGGLCIRDGVSLQEYTELLEMLGIIGDTYEDNEQEQDPHDYQSKYRHYRNIGVA